MKRRFHDSPLLPGTALGPAECLARAQPLEGTDGQAYVERRGIAVAIATAAGVRFCPDWAGRPAVVIALRDRDGEIRSVHGRYLHNVRGEDKMLTIGAGGGAICVLGGWRSDPLIVVEGLFDALSLAVCGHAAVATIGRDVPWLASIAAGRTVHIASDRTRPGEQDAARLAAALIGARVHRLPPPPRCKDWNTALVKRGPSAVAKWLRDNVGRSASVGP
ncbi:MAG TPA: toprim domain-containing protein [Kofleriaceae bacterium]